MAKKSQIKILRLNGLKGRVLRLPAKKKSKKQRFLIVYGSHASLERYESLAQYCSNYGSVVMPDLPGHGGMDPFHKIGLKPSIDNYADYLASFIKVEYKHKKINLVGYSLGHQVVTRMLQRYPELKKQTNTVISIAGFVSGSSFAMEKWRRLAYAYLAKFFSFRLTSTLLRYLVFNKLFLHSFYRHTYLAKAKFEQNDATSMKEVLKMEVKLWQCNDVATWADTSYQMLTKDITQPKINIELWHVGMKIDQYFDAKLNLKSLRKAYKKVIVAKSGLENHSPNTIADEAEIDSLIPKKVKKMLNSL